MAISGLIYPYKDRNFIRYVLRSLGAARTFHELLVAGITKVVTSIDKQGSSQLEYTPFTFTMADISSASANNAPIFQPLDAVRRNREFRIHGWRHCAVAPKQFRAIVSDESSMMSAASLAASPVFLGFISRNSNASSVAAAGFPNACIRFVAACPLPPRFSRFRRLLRCLTVVVLVLPRPFLLGSGRSNSQGGGMTTIDLDDLFNDMYYDADPLEPNPVLPTSEQQLLPLLGTAAGTGATTAVTEPVVSAAPATEEEIRKRKAEAANLTGGGGGFRSSGDVAAGGGNALGSLSPSHSLSSIPTKDLTEAQKVERRERNREHAKRSRLRKKFLLESLQEQIHGLEEQIDSLKNALKQEVPDKAEELISRICGDKEKFTPLPMPSGFGPVKTIMEPDFRLMSALSGSQQNFAISDPTLPDNPIVYVSQGFLDLTGYTLDQVLGRNCRFLQGPGTDQSAVEVIRKGIIEGVDTSVCLLNYKVRQKTNRSIARSIDPAVAMRWETTRVLGRRSFVSHTLYRHFNVVVLLAFALGWSIIGGWDTVLESILCGGIARCRKQYCQLCGSAMRSQSSCRRKAQGGSRQQETHSRSIDIVIVIRRRRWARAGLAWQQPTANSSCCFLCL